MAMPDWQLPEIVKDMQRWEGPLPEDAPTEPPPAWAELLAWIDGTGPALTPQRVYEALDEPFRKGEVPIEFVYTFIMYGLVRACAVKRWEDSGNKLDWADDWAVQAFLDRRVREDRVVRAWEAKGKLYRRAANGYFRGKEKIFF
jgi:hypothetical protein